jgi:hypothetical protein
MEAEANSLRLPSDCNDLITEEERAGMSYLTKSEIMKILAKAEESRRRPPAPQRQSPQYVVYIHDLIPENSLLL